MYSLLALFLIHTYGEDGWIEDHPIFVRVIAILAILQAGTSIYQVPGVHGEQIITRPLYFGLVVITVFDAGRLIESPTYPHAMYLWTALNSFMFIRLIYLSLAYYSFMDRKTLYTFSVASGYLSPMVGQHDLVWIILYAGPAFYAIFVFLDRSLPRAAFKQQAKENLMKPGSLGSQPIVPSVKPKGPKVVKKAGKPILIVSLVLMLVAIGCIGGSIGYVSKISGLKLVPKPPTEIEIKEPEVSH